MFPSQERSRGGFALGGTGEGRQFFYNDIPITRAVLFPVAHVVLF